ncbi:putative inorganic carbon transporter subunit DabA, partial [Klebsiella pneumoniae]
MQLDHHARVQAAAAGATQAIPPLWPLAASVAVNPFLGQAGEDFATAAARLGRAAGIPLTMPRDWYAERHEAGE